MVIKQQRVLNIERHLSMVPSGATLVVGIEETQAISPRLVQLGFPSDREVGDCLLPRAIGRRSLFNAEGGDHIHRDRPKETVYHPREWHWIEYHGPDRVEQSGIRDVPYQRYPRTFISPPAVQLTISSDVNGKRLIVAPPIAYSEENFDLIRHIVNLFLELFGECEVFTDGLEPIIRTPVRLLNWRILPPGRRPWEQMRDEVEPLIQRARPGKQPVIRHRLQTITHYGPQFCAIGQGGFHGYIVYGFPELTVFVLESMYTGNATYVFGDDWMELSKRTKAEILDERRQKDRLIHTEGWEDRVRRLLDQSPEGARG